MSKDPDTRERIVQAAAKLLWERSYGDTGVDALCAAAGVQKGSFYHFFRSKTDLALAAIDHNWEAARTQIFEPIVGSERGGLEMLEAVVDAVDRFQVNCQERGGNYLGCPFGNLGQEMAHNSPQIRERVQEIFLGHCNYLARALERAIERGEVGAGDVKQRARNVFALFEGGLLLAKVANDPSVFRSVVAAIPSVAAQSSGG